MWAPRSQSAACASSQVAIPRPLWNRARGKRPWSGERFAHGRGDASSGRGTFQQGRRLTVRLGPARDLTKSRASA